MKTASGILPIAALAAAWIFLSSPEARGQSATSGARRVPVCTSTYQIDPGRVGPPPARASIRVKARYRAIPLDARTLKAIRTQPRARAFFNGRVLRRLVQLTTDVPITFGKTTLRPGMYDAGFSSQGKMKWRFVVVDRSGKVLVNEPLVLSRAEAEIPCLNLSLIPAGKERRFYLAVRYGTLRGHLALQWVEQKPAKGP